MRAPPMAQSSGLAGAIPPARFTAAGQRYEIAGNQLRFDQGSAPIDYFIGSNRMGRSYLTQREGYLFELPVTWYVRKASWGRVAGL